MRKHAEQYSLTEGSVFKGFVAFLLPLIAGQLLQQLYNVADAWVVGNFADNASFAAVSTVGNLAFLIIGFFSGLSVGAGVIIARFYGAQDRENTIRSIHTTVMFGLISSIIMTVVTYLLVPYILIWMKTPETVLPLSTAYFHIYCAGISTIIMYNMFMAIMRAVGDSLSPLIYLMISSVTNVILDLILVAGFHLGVYGAAFATVFAQGVSALLCFLQMQRDHDLLHIYLDKLKIYPHILKMVFIQGLPAGIQNSALSIGNVTIQSCINAFGEYAMAGQGAHAKIEGFVFIPVISISMALSTFVSQNIGAGRWDRVRKGIGFGLISSLIIAQLIGIIIYAFAPHLLGFFTSNKESIHYGLMFTRLLPLFYIPLALTHGASGTLQGLGKSIIPMVTLLSYWCVFRIIYANIALEIFPSFKTLAWTYPISWCLSGVTLLVILIIQIKNTYNMEKAQERV